MKDQLPLELDFAPTDGAERWKPWDRAIETEPVLEGAELVASVESVFGREDEERPEDENSAS